MTAVDDELRAIIRREADGVVPPDGARERGWARLAAALAADDVVTEPAAPAPAPRTPWLRVVPLTTLIVGVLATVGVGLAGREVAEPAAIAATVDPEPRLFPLPLVLPPAPAREAATPPSPPPDAAPAPPETALAAPRRPAPSRPPVAADEDAFAAELQLLATAQAAIQRGDLREGLAALRRHAQLYPAGHFAQDRDALRAIARCEGEQANAPAAGRRFLAANPTSIHAERVRGACGL
ncbi:hypothetical protein [Nannocystis punicea]|uniref:Tetratricopeptide repeat protein n=1 Tax=Nannocystis punicea TaxID=2995304 RepID=A0ABY7H8V1_9BACT|nr:hypothetical protein [Nannocystis poenicansa]WAS95525.1 hypothetical protein O0S08_05130 [Nannocystis poenicansa]